MAPPRLIVLWQVNGPRERRAGPPPARLLLRRSRRGVDGPQPIAHPDAFEELDPEWQRLDAEPEVRRGRKQPRCEVREVGGDRSRLPQKLGELYPGSNSSGVVMSGSSRAAVPAWVARIVGWRGQWGGRCWASVPSGRP